MLRKRLVLALIFLAISMLACSEWIPEYTPNPPQQTAGALNSTYEAGTATAAAQPTETASATPTASDTPTATITPTDTPSPTSSICELPTLGPGTFVMEVTDCP